MYQSTAQRACRGCRSDLRKAPDSQLLLASAFCGKECATATWNSLPDKVAVFLVRIAGKRSEPTTTLSGDAKKQKTTDDEEINLLLEIFLMNLPTNSLFLILENLPDHTLQALLVAASSSPDLDIVKNFILGNTQEHREFWFERCMNNDPARAIEIAELAAQANTTITEYDFAEYSPLNSPSFEIEQYIEIFKLQNKYKARLRRKFEKTVFNSESFEKDKRLIFSFSYSNSTQEFETWPPLTSLWAKQALFVGEHDKRWRDYLPVVQRYLAEYNAIGTIQGSLVFQVTKKKVQIRATTEVTLAPEDEDMEMLIEGGQTPLLNLSLAETVDYVFRFFYSPAWTLLIRSEFIPVPEFDDIFDSSLVSNLDQHEFALIGFMNRSRRKYIDDLVQYIRGIIELE